MKALVVYCHPNPASFNAAVRDLVLSKLQAAGAEIRLTDLYGENFQPILTPAEWEGYLSCPDNRKPVERHCADVQWCDTLIFVYPTWWYGLPAMLKGWLDRVMLPDVAFLMPDAQNQTIRAGLKHITRLGVFTTCGASRWLTFLVGSPGRKQLRRGIGFICAPRHRKAFAAHYLMDSSTADSRRKHLERVGRQMDRLLGRRLDVPLPQPALRMEAAE
jgi:NAD(P)H dehydrogenase (quinone)